MRISSLRRSLGVLGLAALTFTAVACGSGSTTEVAAEDLGPTGDAAWTEVIEAAKQEGSVTYFTGQATDNLQSAATSFESAYGITVDIVRDNDANLQTKLAAESETGRKTADVVASAARPWIDQQVAEGYFVPVTGPAFDAPEFDRDKFMIDDTIFTSSAAVLTYGWNTNRVPDGLSGYEDLLDPSLTGGKIGVVLPVSAAIVDFYDYLNDVVSPDFVEKLAAQQPRTYPGAQAMSQALTSGELAAAVYTVPLTTEKKAGAPVDSALPTPVFGAAFHTGVVADAPHPNAAQLFANFLVTKAGQEAVANRAGAVLSGVTSAATPAENIWVNNRVVTSEDVEAFRVEFARLFGASQ
ncbi:ABC transporter substrate-binding protein [Rhodococcus chondri]|uniref:Extracellular solute-binding protein n=1 Tax=Rhodococcus chondri TaxID=3065941 RepID=A0ABU7JT36_9NOCA|nr:extracellular solute-binding protein [Rhodococcus sp. CC-R104]MEE2033184.1 extracellular solute-binding protein [Rhodococcus sp. CC-R104]